MTKHESLLVQGFPKVAGECPNGCGQTLFLGEGGHVTCSFASCFNPAAVDDLLRQKRMSRYTVEVDPRWRHLYV